MRKTLRTPIDVDSGIFSTQENRWYRQRPPVKSQGREQAHPTNRPTKDRGRTVWTAAYKVKRVGSWRQGISFSNGITLQKIRSLDFLRDKIGKSPPNKEIKSLKSITFASNVLIFKIIFFTALPVTYISYVNSTTSVSGCDWQVRIYPDFTSSSSRA